MSIFRFTLPGADVHASDGAGTALSYAIENGFTEVAAMISRVM